MNFGSLFQAALEGWLTTRQTRGMKRWLQQEYGRQIEEYGSDEQITWWAKLAEATAEEFIALYEDDPHLPLSCITQSERNCRVEIPLPSGRTCVLNTYLDGEGELPSGGSILMENKTRSRWDPEVLTRELRWDLQYNIYLVALLNETGSLPSRVWYQHVLRPLSWGYRGPRQRKDETSEEHLERIIEHMKANPSTYFYRFLTKPLRHEVERFLWACLYPILEHFLDWYDHVSTSTTSDRS